MSREEAIESLQNFADHAYPNEEFLMGIKALEQIERITKLLKELDLDGILEDITSDEYDGMFPVQYIEHLKDKLWILHCFAGDVSDIINMGDTAEQEAKIGHWIGIDEEPHEDYECDKCGYTISTYTANIEPHTEYKYCPNCGAKMESEVSG